VGRESKKEEPRKNRMKKNRTGKEVTDKVLSKQRATSRKKKGGKRTEHDEKSQGEGRRSRSRRGRGNSVIDEVLESSIQVSDLLKRVGSRLEQRYSGVQTKKLGWKVRLPEGDGSEETEGELTI